MESVYFPAFGVSTSGSENSHSIFGIGMMSLRELFPCAAVVESISAVSGFQFSAPAFL